MEKISFEKDWVLNRIKENDWESITLYAKLNGLIFEVQDIITDIIFEAEGSRDLSIVSAQINVIWSIYEKIHKLSKNAFIVILKHCDFSLIPQKIIPPHGFVSGQILSPWPNGMESYIFENDYDLWYSNDRLGLRKKDRIIKFLKGNTLSDASVEAFVKYYIKNPDFRNDTIGAILKAERPDEIINAIAELDVDLVVTYYKKFKDIPCKSFLLIIQKEKYCLLSTLEVYAITLNSKLLTCLLLNCSQEQIIPYLNFLFTTQKLLEWCNGLTKEDQILFLQREDCNLAIQMYNATYGFDTEVLEIQEREDLLQERTKRCSFSKTKAEIEELERLENEQLEKQRQELEASSALQTETTGDVYYPDINDIRNISTAETQILLNGKDQKGLSFSKMIKTVWNWIKFW